MGAHHIVERLQETGLSLYLLAGDTIRAAPPEAITDEARNLIRQNKVGLIELLRHRSSPHEPAPTPATPDPATTPAAPAAPDDDFAERAAIIEHDGGIPSEWVEGLALICTMVRPEGIPPVRWRHIIHAAGVFADRWAKQAAALGWSAAELFGVHSSGSLKRYDSMGLVVGMTGQGIELQSIAENEAIFLAGPSRARQRWHRRLSNLDDVVPAWELVD